MVSVENEVSLRGIDGSKIFKVLLMRRVDIVKSLSSFISNCQVEKMYVISFKNLLWIRIYPDGKLL